MIPNPAQKDLKDDTYNNASSSSQKFAQPDNKSGESQPKKDPMSDPKSAPDSEGKPSGDAANTNTKR